MIVHAKGLDPRPSLNHSFPDAPGDQCVEHRYNDYAIIIQPCLGLGDGVDEIVDVVQGFIENYGGKLTRGSVGSVIGGLELGIRYCQ